MDDAQLFGRVERKGPETGVPVLCTVEGRSFSAWAANLSAAGVILRAAEAVEEGSEIGLAFAPDAADGPGPLELRGTVVRVKESEWKAQPFRLEVELFALSPETVEALDAFIKWSAADELRRAPRIPTHLKVQYKHQDQWLTGQIEDISEGGLFLTGASSVPVGTSLLLQFLPQGLGVSRPIRVVGEVMRQTKWGMETGLGIQFKSIQRETREDFLRYIRSLLKEMAGSRGENASPEPFSGAMDSASPLPIETPKASKKENAPGPAEKPQKSSKTSFFDRFRRR